MMESFPHDRNSADKWALAASEGEGSTEGMTSPLARSPPEHQ